MKQPYIGNTKINKLYKGSELWCNWSSGESEPVNPSNNPIMNGLVCWLDGRDYVDGSTKWNDRSGLGNHGPLSNTNGVLSNSGLLFEGQVLVNNVTKNLTDYTIIIHYKLKTNSFWSGIFGNTGGSGGTSLFSSSKNTVGVFGNVNGISRSYLMNSENIISIIVICTESNWKVYVNKISNPLFTVQVNTPIANYMNLCCRKPNNCEVDNTGFADSKQNEWYSFKFYNRVLTADEIKHNLAYEEENGRNLYFGYKNETMSDNLDSESPGELSKGGVSNE